MKKRILSLLCFLAIAVPALAQNWGGFLAPVNYTYNKTGVDRPATVFFNDFNDDGHTDFLLDGSTYGQSTFGEYIDRSYIYINNGDGTFQSAVEFLKGSTHRTVTSAEDYDGDGYVDLLAADFWANRFNLYRGKTNLQFEAPVTFSTSTHGGPSLFHDLNGDGDLDMVSVSAGSGVQVQVHVYSNNASAFTKIATYNTAGMSDIVTKYTNVRIDDINNDGKPDIFLIGKTDSNILTLLQGANLTFTPTVYDNYSGTGPGATVFRYAPDDPWNGNKWVSLQDYNDDNYLDVIYTKEAPGVTNPILMVWLGNSAGTYDFDAVDYQTTYTNLLGYRHYWEDVNNDGLVDMITRSKEFGNQVAVYLKTGVNQYEQRWLNTGLLLDDAFGYTALGLEDLNADGFKDLVVIGDDGDLQVFMNAGVPPEITSSVTNFSITFVQGQMSNVTFTIGNEGGADLTYCLNGGAGSTNLALGGGYFFADSDSPSGPAYQWEDIATSGVATALGWNDNIQLAIGFHFPFYGNLFSNLFLCSNGHLSFTESSTAYSNRSLPDSAAPNNLLAMFWDGFHADLGGSIFYEQRDSETFVIQFTEVPHYAPTNFTATFQTVLKSDGRIFLYYQDIEDEVDSATVGIQNSNATEGLQIAYNDSYLKDDLAILIQTNAPFGTITNTQVCATNAPGTTNIITISLDTSTLPPGSYSDQLLIQSNDPDSPFVISIALTVVPPTNYWQWIALYPEISAPENTPTADYDNDGLPNGLEYIQNANPTDANNTVIPPADLSLTINHDGELSWRQRSGGTGTVGIDYVWQSTGITLEFSTNNLTSWISASGYDISPVSTVKNSDGTDNVTVQMLSPMTNQSRLFWRGHIDIPE